VSQIRSVADALGLFVYLLAMTGSAPERDLFRSLLSERQRRRASTA
jgi:hypothetical protein